MLKMAQILNKIAESRNHFAQISNLSAPLQITSLKFQITSRGYQIARGGLYSASIKRIFYSQSMQRCSGKVRFERDSIVGIKFQVF